MGIFVRGALFGVAVLLIYLLGFTAGMIDACKDISSKFNGSGSICEEIVQ